MGAAALFMSPLTQYLLALVGIANTFMILGLGAAVAIVLLAQLLTNPPADYPLAGQTATASKQLAARKDTIGTRCCAHRSSTCRGQCMC